jgi:anti-sigma-K factor RskA
VNVPEYISSGIVESYVLGLASADERSEFESMCRQFPQVLEARVAFELALEKQAMSNAIAPAAGLKEKIIEQIKTPAKVISLPEAPVRKINWLKYAAAACLLLLAGSIYWNISLTNKNKQLLSNNEKLQADYETTVAKLGDIEKDLKMIQLNPAVKMASMKGQPVSPASYATVYWDTASKDAYLLINNLPAPASEMQYQLWALLDGQPIDLGLIDNDVFIKQKSLLVKGKNVQNVQAFAITLEKKGRPDTSKPGGDIYVMGQL